MAGTGGAKGEIVRTSRAAPAAAALLSAASLWACAGPQGSAEPAAAHAVRATAADPVRVADELRATLVEEPLAAHVMIAAHRETLSLATLLQLRGEISASGQARCAAMTPIVPEASPYLARLAAGYCRHFGVVAPELPALPDGVSGLMVTGTIAGMSAAQRAQLDTALHGFLRASPWYEPAAEARVASTIGGRQAVHFAQAPVRLSAAWAQRVSYQDEVWSDELVPVVSPTFSGEVNRSTYVTPHPQYEAPAKEVPPDRAAPERPAPQQKTPAQGKPGYEYRMVRRAVRRTVTRFRDEPRVYRYDAIARTARYRATWDVALALGPAPLELHIDAGDRRTGVDHDAEFAPAGVEPSRARLDDLDRWTQRVILRLAAELPPRLVAQWSVTFCGEAAFTAETAARCARGGAPPAAARAELERLFGADVDRAVAAFARP
jgi:hypothetical protein